MNLHDISYPGVTGYKISEEGLVYSTLSNRFLTPQVAACQYQVYMKTTNGWRWLSVARLMAMTFLGTPPENASVVRHIDHNRLNNHRSNLKWATRSEVQIVSKKDGVSPYRNNKEVVTPVRTPRGKRIVAREYSKVTEYESIQQAANSIGCYPRAISRSIASGRKYMGIEFKTL